MHEVLERFKISSLIGNQFWKIDFNRELRKTKEKN